ncbi:MAG: cation-translocating P-type ATPase [Gammaproteobacteria bacterium]
MNSSNSPYVPAIPHPHAIDGEQVLEILESSAIGLTHHEAETRRKHFGDNIIPRPRPPGLTTIFFRQFVNPLIYILLIAAIVSAVINEWTDALFISAVLLINAIIGMIQEYSAQRNAEALQEMVSTQVRVLRSGDAYEVESSEIVPGDIVLLESGCKIPADMRLLNQQRLEIDESLLTGESLPALKECTIIPNKEIALGDRNNMAFAGTHVTLGRAKGVVVATGLATEIGLLASTLMSEEKSNAPLLARMERFVFWIAIAVGINVLVLTIIALMQGNPLREVFFLAVALAVSAIPEGLPVAMTVALAIGINRMSKRKVIVRRLVAVESLGSCTYVASDKTGTLTVNELTARKIVFPDGLSVEVTGQGAVPEGEFIFQNKMVGNQLRTLLHPLAEAAVLCNEGFLGHRNGSWTHHGDTVDVALLVMAHKAGISQLDRQNTLPKIAEIPFESKYKFAASLHKNGEQYIAYVKGALEEVLPMCTMVNTSSGTDSIDTNYIEALAHPLAAEGYRVLALAAGEININNENAFANTHLRDLKLLGLIGMIDPVRSEAKQSIQACKQAGIQTAMLTGDHPTTALTIAKELEIADDMTSVITGPQLSEAEATDGVLVDQISVNYRVFARLEPQQKLHLVHSLIKQGHFVAVTGDGANDAPALRAAHVGVAMGKNGTDIARENADIIITDDNFSSIVSGIEEGRITYNNIRKVIFLLISTGAAEVVLFLLALLSGLPLPLLAVQLLWLNLVTNGIQHVALAFEPKEGHEMQHPPRHPDEPIFNRIMIERVILSAATVGIIAFLMFAWLLKQGLPVDEARNSTLLLMVLFENVHVFNCRSETRSAFDHNPLRNPVLLFGTLGAQLIHIGTMYIPGLNNILHIQPISLTHWVQLLCLALVLLLVMEIHKFIKKMIQSNAN